MVRVKSDTAAWKLCRKLAEYAIQDRAWKENPIRMVCCKNNFSERDKQDAKRWTKEIAEALSNLDGAEWEEALNRIKEIAPVEHIGFRLQDKIIVAFNNQNIFFRC